MSRAKQLHHPSEVFEEGAIFGSSGEEKQAKEENKRLHFPYIQTRENITANSTVISIFNLPTF